MATITLIQKVRICQVKVRLEVGAGDVAALHVVEDDRDDRRDADQEARPYRP
jgi:hypothetical protein